MKITGPCNTDGCEGQVTVELGPYESRGGESQHASGTCSACGARYHLRTNINRL